MSYQGRKNLPVMARIALLDIRFMEYQHINIGTVETTLNAETMFGNSFGGCAKTDHVRNFRQGTLVQDGPYSNRPSPLL